MWAATRMSVVAARPRGGCIPTPTAVLPLTPPPSIQPSDVACEQQEAGTEAFNNSPPRIGVRTPPSRVRIEDKEHQFYELNLAWRSTTCGGCPKNRCTQTDFPCLLSHALPKPNTLFWPIQSMSNYIALNSQDQNISESGDHIIVNDGCWKRRTIATFVSKMLQFPGFIQARVWDGYLGPCVEWSSQGKWVVSLRDPFLSTQMPTCCQSLWKYPLCLGLCEVILIGFAGL